MQLPVSIWTAYRESLGAYRRRARQLLPVAFVVFVVVGFPTGLLNDLGDARWADIVFSTLAALIGSAAVILYTGYVDEVAREDMNGQTVHVGPVLRSMLPVIWPLAVVGALYMLAILLGVVALLIPGVIIAVRLSLGSPVVSLERLGPVKSLRRSWRLTKGHFWFVAAAVVLPLFAEGSLSNAAAVYVSHLAHDNYVLEELADAIITTLIAPLVGLQMARVYMLVRDEQASG